MGWYMKAYPDAFGKKHWVTKQEQKYYIRCNRLMLFNQL